MKACPRCGRMVEQLHPLPPEIITKEIVAGIGTEDRLEELAACRECIFELMEN